MHAKSTLALASVLLGTVALLTAPAHAACKKFGFTVNDYGKVGPTNDAKNLLDKHISEWASQNGVANYQTGKKSVSCELFIDVILFDEYTCTASATVCWGDDARKVGQQSAAGEDDGGHPGTPLRKAEALGHEAPQTAAIAGTPADDDAPAQEAAQADATAQQDDAAAPAETYADAAPEAPADATQSQAAAADVIVGEPEQPPAVEAAANGTPAQPLDQVTADVSQPVVQPAVATTSAIAVPEVPVAHTVETGALQSGAALANPSTAPAPASPSADGRAAAASAAAAAAAAAERAAQAAETAAEAAKAAAAAAVAASSASKGAGHASVPPLDQAADAGAQ